MKAGIIGVEALRSSWPRAFRLEDLAVPFRCVRSISSRRASMLVGIFVVGELEGLLADVVGMAVAVEVAVELDFDEVLWWPLFESLLAPSLVIFQSWQMASCSVEVAKEGGWKYRDDPFCYLPASRLRAASAGLRRQPGNVPDGLQAPLPSPSLGTPSHAALAKMADRMRRGLYLTVLKL
jgi:hypothetical protein